MGVRVDNVCPLVGFPGERITVTGKGFANPPNNFYIGERELKVVSYSDTELKFLIATNLRRGKFPLIYSSRFEHKQINTNFIIEV
ncbi:IPT/TIG domain-containing protein [Sphingobacterium sp. HJSM2_6]|uniref:IPT/TIG domain-containing protein n=1 Tax=Sphingobacterium sp. HJSM2_6 TaxID=3366264 RepID=UPI003BE63AC6